MVASSFRRDGPGRLGLSRSSLEPRVKSTAREGEAATSYLALRVRWNVAAGFSFFVPSVSCALAAVSFHLYFNVVGCNMRAPGRQKPVSKCRPVGGEVPCITAPTNGINKGSRQRMPRAPSLLSDVEVGRAASLRPVGHATMPARRRRCRANEKPLTVHSKSIRCFPFSSSDCKFLSESRQPGSTEECCR